MRFNELIFGEAADVAEALHGDSPPETIPELRAALTNALRRIAQLEKRLYPPTGESRVNAQLESPQAAARFIKIGADGKPLPADAAEWAAVADSRTGLMWAVEPIKVSNWKAATVKKTEAKVAELRLGGFDDWRIPTVEELFMLADKTRTSPAIDTDFFPDCPSDWFWTSTPYAGAPAVFAWVVVFGLGGAFCDGRSGNGFVRAVRGGQ